MGSRQPGRPDRPAPDGRPLGGPRQARARPRTNRWTQPIRRRWSGLPASLVRSSRSRSPPAGHPPAAALTRRRVHRTHDRAGHRDPGPVSTSRLCGGCTNSTDSRRIRPDLASPRHRRTRPAPRAGQSVHPTHTRAAFVRQRYGSDGRDAFVRRIYGSAGTGQPAPSAVSRGSYASIRSATASAPSRVCPARPGGIPSTESQPVSRRRSSVSAATASNAVA